MKQKILFLVTLMLIFLVGLTHMGSSITDSASENTGSVTISLFYDAANSNSLTITNGENAEIIVSVDSLFENSMTIKLDLLDSNRNVIANLLDVYTTSDSYSNNLIVGQSVYLSHGNYILRGSVMGSPSGDRDTDELSLEVKQQTPPVNNPPVINSNPVRQVNEGQNYVYQIVATDADNDVLIYSLTEAPSWLSIDPRVGLITGIAPSVNQDTNFNIIVKVSDGRGGNTIQSYVLNVRDVTEQIEERREGGGNRVKIIPVDEFDQLKYLNQFAKKFTGETIEPLKEQPKISGGKLEISWLFAILLLGILILVIFIVIFLLKIYG